MTPTPKRAEPLAPATDTAEPLELTTADIAFQPDGGEEEWLQPTESPAREPGAGGRQVLGIALSVLAVAWIAYSAWSAGRTLAGQPLSSPLVAQWLAISASPLVLLGLVWLLFGRTRRKEAERFTRSVVARAEGAKAPSWMVLRAPPST